MQRFPLFIIIGLIMLLLLPTQGQAETYARLTWNPATDNRGIAGYKILRSPQTCALGEALTPLAMVGALTVPEFLDTTPPPNGTTKLCYEVIALDAAGNHGPASTRVEKTIPMVAAPAPITDLRVEQITANSATVTATVPEGVKLLVRVGPSPINWGGTPDLPCDMSPCTVTGLEPARLYQAQAVMYVGVLGKATFGPLSAPVSFTTLPGGQPEKKRCSNLLDDDGDGLIDHPLDPGCVGPDDDDETDPPTVVTSPFKNYRQLKWTDKNTGLEYDAVAVDAKKGACRNVTKADDGDTHYLVCKPKKKGE